MKKHQATSAKGTVTRRGFVHAGMAGAAAWTLSPQILGKELVGGMGPDDALAIATRRRDDLVDLLSQLISIRSHSGESAEVAQDIVKGYLSQLPYRIEASADRPSRFAEHAEFMPPNPPGDGPFVNVVGRPRRATGSQLALFAHIDTHIPEDGWTTDPYEPVVRDGLLHGLGTADDKGGVAAMLVAAAALAEAGGPAPVVMSLHGKGGGSRGSLPVFARLRESGEKLDAVLYVHPAETGHGLRDIKHVVDGSLDVTLAVTGWRGEQREVNRPDSAPWEDGGNALEACWRAIDHLKRGPLSQARVNVGRLEGGNRSGAVPETARAQMRILFQGEHTWGTLLASLRQELDAFIANLPTGEGAFRASIEPAGLRSNPGSVPWDAPTCMVLRRAIAEVTGSEPASYPHHYAGDIRYPLRLLGVPAFGVGSLGGNFYGANEWVDIDDLVRLVAVIVQTVSGWARL